MAGLIIYCIIITAITAFLIGFILGYKSYKPKKAKINNPKKGEHQLIKEYRTLLNYSGDGSVSASNQIH